jgi:hypothetical protein
MPPCYPGDGEIGTARGGQGFTFGVYSPFPRPWLSRFHAWPRVRTPLLLCSRAVRKRCIFFLHMDYPYLVKSKHHLAQYLACNLLPKGYYFYATSWIPEGKDPLLVDAKLMLLYATYTDKAKVARRKKAGHAAVKYMRLGRLCILMATKGESPFFQREQWKDCREYPISFGGYSISCQKVTGKKSGKVSVRLHREATRRLKKFILTWGYKRRREWWEKWIWRFPFLPFAGVRDNLFALIRFLNENRKSFRQDPVDWKICVRKKFTAVGVWEESPREIVELLRWEIKKK